MAQGGKGEHPCRAGGVWPTSVFEPKLSKGDAGMETVAMEDWFYKGRFVSISKYIYG